MGVLAWSSDNWFILLQSIGIIAGLVFTAASLRLDAKTRRVGNLMALTKSHPGIWSELYDRPELARVIAATVDLKQKAMTLDEEWFIRFVILHLNTVYHARKEEVLLNLEGMHKDVRWFFSLPLPQMVWGKLKPLLDG